MEQRHVHERADAPDGLPVEFSWPILPSTLDQVVRGSSTLELVGPGGPTLVAAKLSKMSAAGNTAPKIFPQNLPNDGISLYGKQAKFRLRLYTSGGMTPDGVTPLLPTEYNQYFRVIAVTRSGKWIALSKAGQTYYIDGHPLRVVGLADLGV
jgi:hypothetical protein